MIERHYLYGRIKLVWMVPALLLIILLWGVLLADSLLNHIITKGNDNNLIYGVILTAVILILSYFHVELQYRNYYYEFRDHGLRISHGIIEKRIDEIPYTKIQHVRVERTVFEHLLGLAHIHVEMAGMAPSDDRPTIPGVPMEAYEEMVEFIKHRAGMDTNNQEGSGNHYHPGVSQQEAMAMILQELRLINKRLAGEEKPKPLKKIMTGEEENALKRHKRSDLGQLEEEDIRTHL